MSDKSPSTLQTVLLKDTGVICDLKSCFFTVHIPEKITVELICSRPCTANTRNSQKAWPQNTPLFCSQNSTFQGSKENKSDKLMPSHTSLQRWLTERDKVKDLFEAWIIQDIFHSQFLKYNVGREKTHCLDAA